MRTHFHLCAFFFFLCVRKAPIAGTGARLFRMDVFEVERLSPTSKHGPVASFSVVNLIDVLCELLVWFFASV